MIPTYSDRLPLGWSPPAFSLKGVDGEELHLDELKDYPALLVVFICNHCPYAQAAWPLLVTLHQRFARQVAFLAINADDSRSFPQDEYQEMQKLALEYQLAFPYLHDTQQRVAASFRVRCVPEPFLFTNQGDHWGLFYHGRINDNWQHPDQVKHHDLHQAMLKVLKNDNPPSVQQPAVGCAITWRKQSEV